ncbi:protein DYAD-like [Macadamia integrifolia]|uniref:protein DYAD-like n=1 Tax=Macadamia integrifolia TaxID=60698 RepID=UPI001C4FA560|nr:protein DYAD-like [Macadamia integrifolia]
MVMVTEKTELIVSVKFPSNLSLRTYFDKDPSSRNPQDLAGKVQPALDEQFVIGSRLAKKIFMRQVPSSEVLKQKNLQSFWLVPLEVSESPSCVTKERLPDDPVVKGTCWSALKCAGQVHWGVRRQVTFIGRHKKKMSQPFLVSREGKEVEEEEDDDDEASLGKNRWSVERYKLAEEKLLGIMKEKEAVIGHPMLRPALREEARKHIGDTGLLDHLLKHMAGKVAPGAKERFRRRHNPEGAMEYWLENVNLVNIRKAAGVNDPYWIPPPGWKPGDSPSQHGACARELNLLKEEMAILKREVQELVYTKPHDGEAIGDGDDAKVNDEANATPTTPVDNSQLESATVATRPQEIYVNLVKRKAQLEQQLVEYSNSLKEMQEELGKLSSSSMQVENARSEIVIEEEQQKKEGKETSTDAAAEKEEDDGKGEAAEKKQKLRSGFRICKPQGTFLWPNMSIVGSNILSPLPTPHAESQVNVQVDQDLLVGPTTPSISSATSKPSLLTSVAPPLLTSNPQPSPSPVRPLAEKRGFTVTVSSSFVIPDQSTCLGEDNIRTTRTSTVIPHFNLNLDLNDDYVSCDAAAGKESIVGSDHDVAVVSSAGTTMTIGTDHVIHHHQRGNCSSSVGTWLALATPNPYLDSPTLLP